MAATLATERAQLRRAAPTTGQDAAGDLPRRAAERRYARRAAEKRAQPKTLKRAAVAAS